MFRRRGVRMNPHGAGEAIEMLVAELDGVRTYLRRQPVGRQYRRIPKTLL